VTENDNKAAPPKMPDVTFTTLTEFRWVAMAKAFAGVCGLAIAVPITVSFEMSNFGYGDELGIGAKLAGGVVLLVACFLLVFAVVCFINIAKADTRYVEVNDHREEKAISKYEKALAKYRRDHPEPSTE